MKHLPVSLTILFAATLATSPARADDCGEKDRVPLPSCAWTGRIQGTKPGYFVQNSCSYPITVKFAKSGGDERADVAAGKRIDQVPLPDNTVISCCPRYNKCADAAPATPSGATKQDTSCWTPAFTNCVNANGGKDAGAKLCYPNYTGCMANYKTPTAKESTCWQQAFVACVDSGNQSLAGTNGCHQNYLGCLSK